MSRVGCHRLQMAVRICDAESAFIRFGTSMVLNVNFICFTFPLRVEFGRCVCSFVALYICVGSDFVKVGGGGSAANTIDKYVEKVVVLPDHRSWGVDPLGRQL